MSLVGAHFRRRSDGAEFRVTGVDAANGTATLAPVVFGSPITVSQPESAEDLQRHWEILSLPEAAADPQDAENAWHYDDDLAGWRRIAGPGRDAPNNGRFFTEVVRHGSC